MLRSRSQRRDRAARPGRGLHVLAALVMALALVAPGLPAVQAAGGAYTLNWSAADPEPNSAPYLPTYPKLTPGSAPACPVSGRAQDPLRDAIFGAPKDSVESLAPEWLALGTIVPFEVLITVNGDTTPENGVIQFTGRWLAKTTQGGDFGFDPAYGVLCAFVDYGDAASIDPLANAQVDSYASTTVSPGTGNEAINGTIVVSGLESGDSIVVEIWVVLKDYWPPTGATGNVQTGLVSATTATGDRISTGNQTVPLLRVGEFTTSDVDLRLTKTDGDISAGWYSTYDYTLTIDYPLSNATGAVANEVVVVDTLDPNLDWIGPVSITDPNNLGRTCNYDPLAHQVTCDLMYMLPGETVVVVFEVYVKQSTPIASDCEVDTNGAYTSATPCGGCTTAPDVCNTACVNTISDDIDPTNDCDDEPKDITLPTSVELQSFTARGLDNGAVLRWVTVSETNNAGYNLYRARWPRGPRTKVSAELIPTLVAPGSLEGALYRYRNLGLKDNTVYYYWLEAVNLYGGSTTYGPVGVRTK